MTLPEWVKEFKTKGIEIRKRGNRYHAYRITSKWDPEKKRSQKKTLEYLGVVTPHGIIKPRKMGMLKGDYEYGHIALFWKLAEEDGLISQLKKHYPYQWEQMLSFAFLRLIQPLPLKSIQHLYSKTYLMKLFQTISMTPKSLSSLLQSLGENFTVRERFMRALTQKGKYTIIDLTTLFSYSQNIILLENGYNKDHLHMPQINMLMLFSADFKLPTYVRLLAGSVRDVTTIKNTIKLANLKDSFFVSDRGFYSKENIRALRDAGISFVMPLKRNSNLIPKVIPTSFKGIFLFNERPIIYWKRNRKPNFLYIFEDKALKKDEETTFLKAVESGTKTIEMYLQEKNKFGKLFIISNVDEKPEIIYNLYKDREQIEYAFNVFKNLLEVDKSHLQSTPKLEGYIFLNLLSLYIYYLVLNKIKECELNKKFSVNDIILQLSKIKIYDFEQEELLNEIPKQVRKIIEKIDLNLDRLRIKLPS